MTLKYCDMCGEEKLLLFQREIGEKPNNLWCCRACLALWDAVDPNHNSEELDTLILRMVDGR
jgi:hypothetical protein